MSGKKCLLKAASTPGDEKSPLILVPSKAFVSSHECEVNQIDLVRVFGQQILTHQGLPCLMILGKLIVSGLERDK